jgi:hypothetical protein
MTTLILLQNAWDPRGRSFLEEKLRLTKLAESPTGRRLRKLLGDNPDFRYENTTPVIASNSRYCPPPDESHIARLLAIPELKLIIACGRQAERAVRSKWNGPLICIPHPTYRRWNKDMVEKARGFIKQSPLDRIAIRFKGGDLVRQSL